MDVAVLIAILALAIILVVESKGRVMPDWLSQTAVGAIVGSSLSAWWRRAIRWQANLAAGFFIGWWGADYAIVALGLPQTIETARAVSSGLGLVGYSLMDGVMRIPWGAMLGRVANRAAERMGAGK